MSPKAVSSHENMKAKFAYVGIRVKDLEASVAFYTKVLGMKDLGRSEVAGTGGKNANVASEDGGFNLELNFYPKGSRFASEYVVGEGLDHLAFQVEDVDKALAEAKKAGHPVVLDMKTPTSRWAYIADPNGIWIELFA
jgi:lactoylglutathione lyase